MNTPASIPLYDPLHIAHAHRRAVQLGADLHPLLQEARAQLLDRIYDLKKPMHTIWFRGFFAPGWTESMPREGQNCHFGDESPPAEVDLLVDFFPNGFESPHEAAFLAASRQFLRPGGLYLGVFWGPQTLHELRHCLSEAEIALKNGLSARFHPLLDPERAANLLIDSGFSLPVVDRDQILAQYTDMGALIHDLRAMGMTNALSARPRTMTSRQIFIQAAQIYANRFKDVEGFLPATFEYVYLHGWNE